MDRIAALIRGALEDLVEAETIVLGEAEEALSQSDEATAMLLFARAEGLKKAMAIIEDTAPLSFREIPPFDGPYHETV